MNACSSRFAVRNPRCRTGLSLLEVIIATAVLAASAAVIAQMVGVAVQHVSRVDELTQAHTLCHNIMNELVAGIRPWENVTSAQAIDPWTPWEYEVKIESLGFANLAAISVTVMPRPVSGDVSMSPAVSSVGGSGDGSSGASETGSGALAGTDGRRRYRWTRWVRQDAPSETTGRTSEPSLSQSAGSRT